MKHRSAHGMFRWIVISGAILTVASVGSAAFWFSRPVVTVTHLVDGPVVNSFYATGTVQPLTEYPIKASNAGMITTLYVDKGSKVTKGDRLAVVEDPQLQYKLDKAKADLKQAEERANKDLSPVLKEYAAKLTASEEMLGHAAAEVKRLTEAQAQSQRSVSLSDLEKAQDHWQDMNSQKLALLAQREAAQLQLNTDLQVAKAAVAAAQRDFDWQTIRSPITGVVLDRPTPQGTRLNVNDHIMQIANVDPANLRVRAAVDEENKVGLNNCKVVRIALYAYRDRIFEGKVSHIYEKADPDRRTFEVDISFDAPPDELSPGMTGELACILEEKKHAVIAPAQALQHDRIYTVRNGRLVWVRDAKVGSIKSVERIEITGGLHLGDVIVISPVQDVAEGSSVRTKEIDPLVAAGLNKPSADAQRNPLGGR